MKENEFRPGLIFFAYQIKMLYIYRIILILYIMKQIVILLLVVFFSFGINAQENTANHWYFGEYCGVDFSHGVPYGISGGQITGWEGCSTVGDMDGNLLFYTDGQVVYDKNHNVMENGADLMGHWSSAQSSLIVRVPQSNDKFYLFTTDEAGEQHFVDGWRYSIIDMTQNGGLGAVTETKNVLLEEMVTERQVAIMHANNINVWIIAHKWNSNEFIAYEITPEGISEEPVISALGTVIQGGSSPNPIYNGWTNGVGFFKSTKEGDKIANSIQIMGIYEVFDFDKSTGIVSNCRTSPTYAPVYGIEFSPDGTKLYATNNIYGVSNLLQYDLEQEDPFSNPIVIAQETKQTRGLQIGPNGKIYATRYQGNYLAEINYPDETGTACGYESDAVYLDGEICRSGLPSIFFYKGFNFFTGSEVFTSICEGDSIFLQNAYQTLTGTYYDTVQSYLGWDSIVNTHLTVLEAGTPPFIYENEGVLYSSTLTAEEYRWFYNEILIPGAEEYYYEPTQTGFYRVDVIGNTGCPGMSDDYYYIMSKKSELHEFVNVNFYPNPASDIVYLKTDKLVEGETLMIFDVTGKLVHSEELTSSQNRINVKQIRPGAYVFVLKKLGIAEPVTIQ
jgi:hypothetical protein